MFINALEFIWCEVLEDLVRALWSIDREMGKIWCELHEHIANMWLLRENYVAISVLSAGSAVFVCFGQWWMYCGGAAAFLFCGQMSCGSNHWYPYRHTVVLRRMQMDWLCGGALTLPDKNRCFEVNSASLAKKIRVGGLQNTGGGVYNTCNTLHADVAFPTSFSIVRLAF